MTDEEFAALRSAIEARLKSSEPFDLEMKEMCNRFASEAVMRELLALIGAGPTQNSAFTAPVYVDPKSCLAPKPTIGENQYQCDCCRGIFNKGWSDEEALQEAAQVFPGLDMKDAAITCDDCYKQLMAWEAKEGRGDRLHS